MGTHDRISHHARMKQTRRTLRTLRPGLPLPVAVPKKKEAGPLPPLPPSLERRWPRDDDDDDDPHEKKEESPHPPPLAPMLAITAGDRRRCCCYCCLLRMTDRRRRFSFCFTSVDDEGWHLGSRVIKQSSVRCCWADSSRARPVCRWMVCETVTPL